MDPVGHGACHALNIRSERRVIGQVMGGVLPDDVDNARVRLASVVQVGQAIAQTGAEVQQRGCGALRQAVVAIGGACHHPFKQSQDAADAWHCVQCRHKVHLGRAGIGETHLHLVMNQGANQTFCTIHHEKHCQAKSDFMP